MLKIVIALICIFSTTSTIADELNVIISGKAYHTGGSNLNEDNFGLGLQYNFDERRHWIPLINFATLKDSNDNTSHYVGGGIKRRFRLTPTPTNFDIGAFALIMKRPGYNDDEPFFGALPFISMSNDWGGLNLTYVPEFEADMHAFWYLQFTLKLARF